MDAFRISTQLAALDSIGIARGKVAGLQDARGTLLRVETGIVWITQDGANEDVCLSAGESFHIGRDGLTLVSALGRSAMALVSLETPATPA
jgi:hypothetical protein